MIRRSPLLLLLALAALLAVPAGAGAGVSPKAFMGVNADGLTFDGGPKLGKGLSAMRKRGVGTLRATFYWRTAQPYAQMSDVPASQKARYVEVDGRPTDFGPTDSLVGAAAERGIAVLPVVIGAPGWASTQPDKAFAPPKSTAQFGRFAAVLVRRYGPEGSFWEANPSVPRRPIRDWQIWNEPAGFLGFGDTTIFWAEPFSSSLTTYVKLLRSSRKEIKRADSGARIVLSGFYGQSWNTMAQLYRAGARKLFDTVTIHPYASKVSDVVKIAALVRDVMRANGDARKPMMLTEFGWTSARGKVPDENPAQRLTYIEKSERDQAKLLAKAYSTLWAGRGGLRLRGAYWYTWARAEQSTTMPFDYAGLYRLKSDGSIVAKPAAAAYRKFAAQIRNG